MKKYEGYVLKVCDCDVRAPSQTRLNDTGFKASDLMHANTCTHRLPIATKRRLFGLTSVAERTSGSLADDAIIFPTARALLHFGTSVAERTSFFDTVAERTSGSLSDSIQITMLKKKLHYPRSWEKMHCLKHEHQIRAPSQTCLNDTGFNAF